MHKMGATERAQREIAMKDWAAREQELKSQVWKDVEDAPMDKEERERLKKEEAEEKKKKEEEAAERAKEAAQAMTEEERQAAAKAQLEEAGKQEDAEEAKLFMQAVSCVWGDDVVDAPEKKEGESYELSPAEETFRSGFLALLD